MGSQHCRSFCLTAIHFSMKLVMTCIVSTILLSPIAFREYAMSLLMLLITVVNMRYGRTEAQTVWQKYPHPLGSSSLLLLLFRSINWRASFWGRKMSLEMEQNANESCINVCAIQVQNRAGRLTMRDGSYCTMLT